MNRLKVASIIATMTVTIALMAPRPAHASAYNFQTYDNPADLTFNQLLGINNAGTIAGYYGSGATGHPNKGYTLATPNAYTSENYPGSVQTQVTGINNTGTTVGFYAPDNSGSNFGFFDQAGTFTTVNDSAVSSSPAVNQLLGVNDSGIAVGFYNDSTGNSHGYTYDIGTKSFTAITNSAATSLTAAAINNNGEIGGFYTNAGGITLGFLDYKGNFTSLSAPGATATMFFGVNDNGLAVGQATLSSGATDGVIYNSVSNSWLELNDPFGIGTTTFNGINDNGTIVGFYVDTAGNTDGLVATPVPEPATLFLFGTGLLALVMVRRRRT